jgi:hypothetical protein
MRMDLYFKIVQPVKLWALDWVVMDEFLAEVLEFFSYLPHSEKLWHPPRFLSNGHDRMLSLEMKVA